MVETRNSRDAATIDRANLIALDREIAAAKVIAAGNGLPARAVRTRWLDSYLRHLPRMQAAAHKKLRCTLHFDCLLQYGLRGGIARIGQFCIDTQLAAARRGDVQKGLFFRGASALPFGAEIRPVRELVEYLLTGARPQHG